MSGRTRPVAYVVTEQNTGAVLSALRRYETDLTWKEARRLLEARQIGINGILCIDEGRRVHAGDSIEVRTRPFPPPPTDEDVAILFADPHIVVVNKPSGMLSLRHPGDVAWNQARKDRQPSLEEVLIRRLAKRERRNASDISLLAVHRIDRETSGVLMMARTEPAQQGLIEQFAAHKTHRRYACVIPGSLPAQRLESRMIRDRGDGLRGLTSDDDESGLRMVTHIRPLRTWKEYSELECRLETGRTNQIRIQLAEMGHPLCGDVKYRGPFGAEPIADRSNAPRLALHAAELGFVHPITGQEQRFQVPWPAEMLKWLAGIRK